jgi:hypothetical protein
MISANLKTAGRTFDEIMCFLSIMMLCTIIPDKMPEHLPGKMLNFPQRYDGNHWKYIGFKEGISGSGSRISMGVIRTDSRKCKMVYYNFHFAPFIHRKFLNDNEIDVCQAVYKNEDLDEKQKEIAAMLIANDFIAKAENGELTCNIPVITKEQHALFIESAIDIFADIIPLYSKKAKEFVDGHVEQFPKHLKNDALSNSYFLFGGMFKAIASEWIKEGRIKIPHNAICDALIIM